MLRRFGFLVLSVIHLHIPLATAADWQPAEGPLQTRWAAEVTPENVHAEHPRPQLMRPGWQNLNGLWEYAIRGKDESQPTAFDGQILVPFAVESALSGVMKTVGPDNALWYRRTFETPDLADGETLRLHFGGVDWHARVWVNGSEAGEHKGGYDAFSLDITDFVKQKSSAEIVVRVWDPTDAGFQPRGKQVREPKGIWYTSVTGIWRTVWLERLPKSYVDTVKITPDVDAENVQVDCKVVAPRGNGKLRLTIRDGDNVIYTAAHRLVSDEDRAELNSRVIMPVKEARLWSPDDPHLYDLQLTIDWEDATVDQVSSYFGMRKIEVRSDPEDDYQRLFLNNQPLFQFGPLDQGWWPDGLYTAPTDEALRYDIEVTKKLGFNMCRKHVKVEPDRWYYWCDKLGLMVWQDMPNGDRHIGPDDDDLERSPESAENYRREFQALIDSHYNHPCIVAWVPFNEGWGQFDTDKILSWTGKHDPTRLVDGPSGWADRETGDMHDMHQYPGPAMPATERKRAAVLGEFGGLGLPVEGHLWWDKRNWGYRTYTTSQELQQNYEELMSKLLPLIGRGLAAAIYTQTTDVEGEVNGLMTYDREIVKYDAERLAEIHHGFYLPRPIVKIKVLIPTSEKTPQSWRYTTSKPSEDWPSVGFDDASWESGRGGFGERSTPGSRVRTEWKSDDIWLRTVWELETSDLDGLHLRIHHDEDAEIYVNGRQIASLSGYVGDYVELPIEASSRDAWRAGKNTVAVHCHQTSGGQYIDAGLVQITETQRK